MGLSLYFSLSLTTSPNLAPVESLPPSRRTPVTLRLRISHFASCLDGKIRIWCNQEGFALDWSPTEEGRLASGDCGNNIYVTRTVEGGWATDPVPFVGHVGSVEDLQWSPTESSVSNHKQLLRLQLPSGALLPYRCWVKLGMWRKRGALTFCMP